MLQGQQRKHSAHDRPRHKVRAARRIPARLGVIQVRHGAVRRRGADPAGQPGDENVARLTACHGRGKHLPVRLGPRVPRVERHAVLVGYGRVEGALHVEDGLGDEVQLEELVGVDVVEEAWAGS